ncbi:MAG: ABC transporter ATP-binding protein [Candidatus Tectomicrobia bacterium]|nr:ABC transporter ATP-binding protein [Candidatus Tectomicrobia bacterium]
MTPLLEVKDLHVSYGKVAALRGVTLEVRAGEVVTLIGANGAGKSTLLRTLAGLLPSRQGEISLEGRRLNGLGAEVIARRGLALVPEGRGIFPGLTVYENLEIATTPWRRRGASVAEDLRGVYELFPVLEGRRNQLGWSLSGGEQQMLAIGRALMARPRLMLLDEPSLGLAPNLVRQLFSIIRKIHERGTTVLLVEQNAFMAMQVAQRGYVIELGEIVLSDTSENLAKDARVRAAYLGG